MQKEEEKKERDFLKQREGERYRLLGAHNLKTSYMCGIWVFTSNPITVIDPKNQKPKKKTRVNCLIRPGKICDVWKMTMQNKKKKYLF